MKSRITRMTAALLAAVLSLSLLVGCKPKKELTRYTTIFYDVFDTVTQVIAYCESEEDFNTQMQALHQDLIAYNQLYDIYNDYDGVVNVKTINENAGKAPVQVDDRILSMLELARQMYDLTGGKINIAMGSVLGIWHDYREAAEKDASEADNTLPTQEELEAAAQHCDINDLVIDEEAKTPKHRKRRIMLSIVSIVLFVVLSAQLSTFSFSVTAAGERGELVAEEYERYRERFDRIEKIGDLEDQGFRLLEDQIFAMPLQKLPEEAVDTTEEPGDEVWFYAALDTRYHRLAVFIADASGQILYKTDQLEANYCYLGEMRQPVKKLASVSFQDVDNDRDTDIILIVQCHNDRGDYQEESYKVGDVLFQDDGNFYRDYRISDKINRFDMNKNPACILNFVRDGRSTEFLYTAETLADLLNHNFNVIEEQSYTRNFEKLGKLKVVLGTYRMAEYDVFMIYLIDEQGNIVWSFQPMEDYDNLYALKGIQGKDLDGDGLKDLVVFAKYSYEGENGELLVDTVCTIYYQRTAGFEKDTDFTENYECTEEDTLEALVTKIRAYWGWQT